ncbi:right-handed parallel beta-helix repeat-containing protein [Fulvivirgaceae bacterium BMA12]|uniref:Right-handed parallel beta-helix repeat-containing protein n=1 Tax=Agaribacillus aureus TaxID=3051825 RepID=A0ABT8LBF0_9BACT|nr:right-handed parallel beta-helix repeat-containing protein [Fulvivirgaceae bacterium BMA12]
MKITLNKIDKSIQSGSGVKDIKGFFMHFGVLCLLSFCAIPLAEATTYYVSPSGADTNRGSSSSPFKTISKAAWIAQPGDTIFVREGIYRERVTPPRGGGEGAPIVYMAEPNKRVIIRGSELWSPQWESKGNGIFSAVPDDALFNDIRSDYVDHYNPFKVNLSSTPYQREGRREWERGYPNADSTIVYTCGQVFVNGKQYKEVPFRKELEKETWYYEAASEQLYIHFGDLNPENQQVEITTRRRIFAPITRGLGYIVVQGFIMEHCGNNYPTNFWVMPKWGQRGAVGLGVGHHWVIRKNVIRYAKTFALDAGHVDQVGKAQAAHDNLIELNYILENGSAGILSNSSKNMVIRDNVVMYNNTMRFLGRKRWEQAGIKCHNILYGEVCDNYVAHNYLTYGVWFDNKFPDSRVSRNILLGNGRAGLFLEMSDYDYDRLFADNNIIIENKENPVYIHDASGATFMHNLIANSPQQNKYGQAVIVHQVDDRTRTYHHSFYNNLFINNPITMDIDYPSQLGGKQRSDFNVYDAKPKDKVFRINSATQDVPPWTEEEFLALIKKETGSKDLTLARPGFSGRVPLTLEEWKTFWKFHDVELDANSLLKKGSSVQYSPDSHELVINIPYDPEEVGSKNHEFVDVDYFNNEIAQNGKALPGPFQGLKKGTNKFKIWEGLPILDKGELPDPVTFSSFEP